MVRRSGIAGTRSRRGLVAAVLAVLALAALGACTEKPDLARKRAENPVRGNSVNAQVGDLRLIGLRIEAPSDAEHVQGDNVGLFVTISNDGDTDDQLIAVRTVNAQDVVMREGIGAASPVSIPVPAHSVVSLQYPGGPHLELVGLKFDTRGGVFIPMTFGFQNAGAVNVNVFVEGFSQPTVAPPGSTPAATATARP